MIDGTTLSGFEGNRLGYDSQYSATVLVLFVLNARVHHVRRRRVKIVLFIAVLSFLGWMALRKVRGLLMLGYVDSAIGRMRSVAAAEEQFAAAHPDVGYTCELSHLPSNEQILRLAKDGKDNGYFFEIIGCQLPRPQKPNSMYRVIARPLHSGLPAYCSDQSGIVRYDDGGSVENCVANGAPLGS